MFPAVVAAGMKASVPPLLNWLMAIVGVLAFATLVFLVVTWF